MTNPIEIKWNEDEDGKYVFIKVRPYVGHLIAVSILKRMEYGHQTLFFSDMIHHRPVANESEGMFCPFLESERCEPHCCANHLKAFQARHGWAVKTSGLSPISLSTALFKDLTNSTTDFDTDLISDNEYSDSELRKELLIAIRWLLKE